MLEWSSLYTLIANLGIYTTSSGFDSKVINSSSSSLYRDRESSIYQLSRQASANYSQQPHQHLAVSEFSQRWESLGNEKRINFPREVLTTCREGCRARKASVHPQTWQSASSRIHALSNHQSTFPYFQDDSLQGNTSWGQHKLSFRRVRTNWNLSGWSISGGDPSVCHWDWRPCVVRRIRKIWACRLWRALGKPIWWGWQIRVRTDPRPASRATEGATR